jgi:hypothetical protein
MSITPTESAIVEQKVVEPPLQTSKVFQISDILYSVTAKFDESLCGSTDPWKLLSLIIHRISIVSRDDFIYGSDLDWWMILKSGQFVWLNQSTLSFQGWLLSYTYNEDRPSPATDIMTCPILEFHIERDASSSSKAHILQERVLVMSQQSLPRNIKTTSFEPWVMSADENQEFPLYISDIKENTERLYICAKDAIAKHNYYTVIQLRLNGQNISIRAMPGLPGNYDVDVKQILQYNRPNNNQWVIKLQETPPKIQLCFYYLTRGLSILS